MRIKQLTIWVVMVVMALPAAAVLKERNMSQALSVLRNELTSTHQEQLVRMQRFNEMNRRLTR